MTYAWATWLADALRADPVLAPKVIEVDGWKTRGRPPSQFSFAPSGLLEHHTACMCRIGHDPRSCLGPIVNGHGSTPGPIAQLFGTFTAPGVRWDGTNLDPHIFVCAAGRSNHAGAGNYSWGAPGGNGSAIGTEWCGPVPFWPPKVMEFRRRVSAALLRNRQWGVHQVDTHFSYATPLGRKIDVSGAHEGEPHLGLLDPWDVNVYRRSLVPFMRPEPILPPPPPPQGAPVNYSRVEVLQPHKDNRVIDSRDFGPEAGRFGNARGSDNGERRILCPRAAGAAAVRVNVTAVEPRGGGHLTMWRSGPRPEEQSKLNYTSIWQPTFDSRQWAALGLNVANEVEVPVAPDGSFMVYASGDIHMVIDLVAICHP